MEGKKENMFYLLARREGKGDRNAVYTGGIKNLKRAHCVFKKKAFGQLISTLNKCDFVIYVVIVFPNYRITLRSYLQLVHSTQSFNHECPS